MTRLNEDGEVDRTYTPRGPGRPHSGKVPWSVRFHPLTLHQIKYVAVAERRSLQDTVEFAVEEYIRKVTRKYKVPQSIPEPEPDTETE